MPPAEVFVISHRDRGLSDRLSKLATSKATLGDHVDDLIMIDDRTFPREDVATILGGKLDSLPPNVRKTTRIPLGNYHGLKSGILLNPQYSPDA